MLGPHLLPKLGKKGTDKAFIFFDKQYTQTIHYIGLKGIFVGASITVARYSQ